MLTSLMPMVIVMMRVSIVVNVGTPKLYFFIIVVKNQKNKINKVFLFLFPPMHTC